MSDDVDRSGRAEPPAGAGSAGRDAPTARAASSATTKRSRRCGPRSSRPRRAATSSRRSLGATVTHRIVIRYSADITIAPSLPRRRTRVSHRHDPRARQALSRHSGRRTDELAFLSLPRRGRVDASEASGRVGTNSHPDITPSPGASPPTLPACGRGRNRQPRKIPMPTASVALRAAIHDALTADAALTALLGRPEIYDEPPASASFPYVTLGEARVTDFSTGERARRGASAHAARLVAPGRPPRGAPDRRRAAAGARRRAAHARRPSPRQPALRARRHPPRGRRAHLSRAGAVSRGDGAGLSIFSYRWPSSVARTSGARSTLSFAIKPESGSGSACAFALHSRPRTH